MSQKLTGYQRVLRFFGIGPLTLPTDKMVIPDVNAKPSTTQIKPPRRSTEPPQARAHLVPLEENEYVVEPGYQLKVLPKIRRLVYSNQDVAQALHNIVTLANTGHKITFDPGVKQKDAIRMREHIINVAPSWHYGVADINALVNKFFSQILISGAICTEFVPNNALTGISRVFLPLPETIRFKYNKAKQSYKAYQQVLDGRFISVKDQLKELNPNTFRYYGTNGDTEIPYAYPPYLPAIPALDDQNTIWENIKWIIQQMGAWGFLEVIATVPSISDGENELQYAQKVEAHLKGVRDNILSGMRDGVVVGSKQDHTDEKDHEFKFHSISKSAAGLTDVVNLNELKVSAGLKQDPMLTGKSNGGKETSATILFTKLLAEQVNVQANVKKVLEDLYTLELRLRGYNFKYIKVKFNPSTILDDLKNQQAQEIKIRNARQLVMDGIISQDQYADIMGYDEAYQQKPVVPYQPVKSTGDPNLDAEKKRVREKSKDVSDRRVRDKNKPQGSK